MSLGTEGVGLLAAGGSVLLFSLFSLPTKTHNLGDGLTFQLLMCLGIWTVGCVVLGVQCTLGAACPQLSLLAAAGGALWTVSNVFLTSIVKCIGVGPAMLQWGLAECLTGWATARFGLFGLAPQPVQSPAANYAGVALAVGGAAYIVAASYEDRESKNALLGAGYICATCASTAPTPSCKSTCSARSTTARCL